MNINKINRFSPTYVKRSRREAGLTRQHGYTKPKSFRGLPLRPAQQYTPDQLAQKGFDPKYFESANSVSPAICAH